MKLRYLLLAVWSKDFLVVKPINRVRVMLNASNLLDKAGFFEFNQSEVPANGVGWGRSINGRTVSLSAKLGF